MKSQIEIHITDIFPNYNPSNLLRSGLNRQDNFLFERQSEPLYCPVCQGFHTVNELVLSEMKCRAIELRESIGLLGGISVLVKKNQQK